MVSTDTILVIVSARARVPRIVEVIGERLACGIRSGIIRETQYIFRDRIDTRSGDDVARELSALNGSASTSRISVSAALRQGIVDWNLLSGCVPVAREIAPCLRRGWDRLSE